MNNIPPPSTPFQQMAPSSCVASEATNPEIREKISCYLKKSKIFQTEQTPPYQCLSKNIYDIQSSISRATNLFFQVWHTPLVFQSSGGHIQTGSLLECVGNFMKQLQSKNVQPLTCGITGGVAAAVIQSAFSQTNSACDIESFNDIDITFWLDADSSVSFEQIRLSLQKAVQNLTPFSSAKGLPDYIHEKIWIHHPLQASSDNWSVYCVGPLKDVTTPQEAGKRVKIDFRVVQHSERLYINSKDSFIIFPADLFNQGFYAATLCPLGFSESLYHLDKNEIVCPQPHQVTRGIFKQIEQLSKGSITKQEELAFIFLLKSRLEFPDIDAFMQRWQRYLQLHIPDSGKGKNACRWNLLMMVLELSTSAGIARNALLLQRYLQEKNLSLSQFISPCNEPLPFQDEGQNVRWLIQKHFPSSFRQHLYALLNPFCFEQNHLFGEHAHMHALLEDFPEETEVCLAACALYLYTKFPLEQAGCFLRLALVQKKYYYILLPKNPFPYFLRMLQRITHPAPLPPPIYQKLCSLLKSEGAMPDLFQALVSLEKVFQAMDVDAQCITSFILHRQPSLNSKHRIQIPHFEREKIFSAYGREFFEPWPASLLNQIAKLAKTRLKRSDKAGRMLTLLEKNHLSSFVVHWLAKTSISGSISESVLLEQARRLPANFYEQKYQALIVIAAFKPKAVDFEQLVALPLDAKVFAQAPPLLSSLISIMASKNLEIDPDHPLQSLLENLLQEPLDFPLFFKLLQGLVKQQKLAAKELAYVANHFSHPTSATKQEMQSLLHFLCQMPLSQEIAEHIAHLFLIGWQGSYTRAMLETFFKLPLLCLPPELCKKLLFFACDKLWYWQHFEQMERLLLSQETLSLFEKYPHLKSPCFAHVFKRLLLQVENPRLFIGVIFEQEPFVSKVKSLFDKAITSSYENAQYVHHFPLLFTLGLQKGHIHLDEKKDRSHLLNGCCKLLGANQADKALSLLQGFAKGLAPQEVALLIQQCLFSASNDGKTDDFFVFFEYLACQTSFGPSFHHLSGKEHLELVKLAKSVLSYRKEQSALFPFHIAQALLIGAKNISQSAITFLDDSLFQHHPKLYTETYNQCLAHLDPGAFLSSLPVKTLPPFFQQPSIQAQIISRIDKWLDGDIDSALDAFDALLERGVLSCENATVAQRLIDAIDKCLVHSSLIIIYRGWIFFEKYASLANAAYFPLFLRCMQAAQTHLFFNPCFDDSALKWLKKHVGAFLKAAQKSPENKELQQIFPLYIESFLAFNQPQHFLEAWNIFKAWQNLAPLFPKTVLSLINRISFAEELAIDAWDKETTYALAYSHLENLFLQNNGYRGYESAVANSLKGLRQYFIDHGAIAMKVYQKCLLPDFFGALESVNLRYQLIMDYFEALNQEMDEAFSLSPSDPMKLWNERFHQLQPVFSVFDKELVNSKNCYLMRAELWTQKLLFLLHPPLFETLSKYAYPHVIQSEIEGLWCSCGETQAWFYTYFLSKLCHLPDASAHLLSCRIFDGLIKKEVYKKNRDRQALEVAIGSLIYRATYNQDIEIGFKLLQISKMHDLWQDEASKMAQYAVALLKIPIADSEALTRFWKHFTDWQNSILQTQPNLHIQILLLLLNETLRYCPLEEFEKKLQLLHNMRNHIKLQPLDTLNLLQKAYERYQSENRHDLLLNHLTFCIFRDGFFDPFLYSHSQILKNLIYECLYSQCKHLPAPSLILFSQIINSFFEIDRFLTSGERLRIIHTLFHRLASHKEGLYFHHALMQTEKWAHYLKESDMMHQEIYYAIILQAIELDYASNSIKHCKALTDHWRLLAKKIPQYFSSLIHLQLENELVRTVLEAQSPSRVAVIETNQGLVRFCASRHEANRESMYKNLSQLCVKKRLAEYYLYIHETHKIDRALDTNSHTQQLLSHLRSCLVKKSLPPEEVKNYENEIVRLSLLYKSLHLLLLVHDTLIHTSGKNDLSFAKKGASSFRSPLAHFPGSTQRDATIYATVFSAADPAVSCHLDESYNALRSWLEMLQPKEEEKSQN